MKSFDYNHPRAKRARLGYKLNRPGIKFACYGLAITFFALAMLVFFYFRSSWCWTLLGLAIFCALPPYWIKWSLVKLQRDKDDSIVNFISRGPLMRIPKDASTKDIINAALQCKSSIFLANRYGLFPEVVNIYLSGVNFDTDSLFNKAFELRNKLNIHEISGATIVVAALELCPSIEDGLRAIKLSTEAIEGGLQWYNYLGALMHNNKLYRNTGGIARDLDFGYANLLERFATNVSAQYASSRAPSVNIASHHDNIQQLVDIFTRGTNQSVVLVGDEGSGRETVVRAFASQIMDAKADKNLRFRQIFKMDANALIAAANGRGQLEALITAIFNEAYSAKNIILWLDNAKLFFEEETGAVNMSNILSPILDAGRLRIILSMTKQQFLEVSAKNPVFASNVNRVNVEPANKQETIAVMQDQAPYIEYKNNQCVITYWALEEAYRLGSRYIQDLVMPGQAVVLLSYAAAYPINGLITEQSVQTAIEQNFGVKMQSTQTSEDKDKLLNLEEQIHERMIDQEGAVKAVSNALRRSAAGVRNENRPIGTFLFLGPTGVGKTELAKAISQVYFHNESEIVRVDLNEYVQESDVNRLIAAGSENENSLCAQIAKKPFSVVLFDEIEKAHSKVLTTLLQLLDEGVLRDSRNHEISFRDAIVICTSNAGADKIREYIDNGEQMSTIREKLSDELIHSGEFKPEFINRFDEVCVFEPLSKENLLKIVDLMLKGTNKTLEPQKISISLDDAAKTLLVDEGYDPKLGARPMRRIVQNTVENIVAKRVLSGQALPGTNIEITSEDIKNQLNS